VIVAAVVWRRRSDQDSMMLQPTLAMADAHDAGAGKPPLSVWRDKPGH